MQKLQDILDTLELDIYLAQENGTVLKKDNWTNLPLEIGGLSIPEIDRIKEESLLLLYQDKGNGFRLSWEGREKNLNGNLEFLKIENMLQDWSKKGLYTEKDLIENDLMEYYKPFDLVSETISCGLLITNEFVGKSIYLHHAPNSALYNLDIDFESYILLAREARIFQYWQKVLLELKNNSPSLLTKEFKTNMPLIFPDFKWDTFVDIYTKCRLSLK